VAAKHHRRRRRGIAERGNSGLEGKGVAGTGDMAKGIDHTRAVRWIGRHHAGLACRRLAHIAAHALPLARFLAEQGDPSVVAFAQTIERIARVAAGEPADLVGAQGARRQAGSHRCR
jgi:hypothetical protein